MVTGWFSLNKICCPRISTVAGRSYSLKSGKHIIDRTLHWFNRTETITCLGVINQKLIEWDPGGMDEAVQIKR